MGLPHSVSTCQDMPGTLHPVLVPPISRWTLKNRIGSSDGSARMIRELKSLSEERMKELGLFSLRRKGSESTHNLATPKKNNKKIVLVKEEVLFSPGCICTNMRWQPQIASGEGKSGYQNNKFFTERATKHQKRLLREEVEPPYWKKIKNQLDRVPDNLV